MGSPRDPSSERAPTTNTPRPLSPRYRAQMPDIRRRQLIEVAEAYYLDGRSMVEIAQETGLSRSTVSRMLTRARERGVVEITVHSEERTGERIAQVMAQRHGVAAQIVAVPQTTRGLERLNEVARHAATLLHEIFGPEMTLAVPWGTSVAAVARELTPKPAKGSRVVQLNGTGNVFTSGLNYASSIFNQFGAAFGASVHPFPVPAFFDRASTRELMWQERSLARVIELRKSADVLISSVGTVGSDIPGHLYRAGYLERSDLEDLRERGVVGDIGAIFVRADGSWDEIPLNERSSGMPLSELNLIPRRLLVATGRGKAEAVRAALLARAFTDVVLDVDLAMAVTDLDRRGR